MKNSLREACSSRGEIDCGIVFVSQLYIGSRTRTVRNEPVIVLGKSGTVLSYIEKEPVLADLLSYLLNSADEFGTEHKHIDLSEIEAVLYLIRGIPEIERYSKSTCFEYTKVNRQPLKAVHKEDTHLITLGNAPFEEHICKAVCLFIEHAPGYLTSVMTFRVGFNELVLLPCDSFSFLYLGIDLDKANIICELTCISFEKLSDWHYYRPFILAI